MGGFVEGDIWFDGSVRVMNGSFDERASTGDHFDVGSNALV